MPTRPKFHRILSERTLHNGWTEYTLQYNAQLFEDAKCRDIDTELFYPPKERFTLDEEKYISERLCGGCPAKEACLEWGIVHERFGIWGGLTAWRRSLLRRTLKWGFSEISLPSTKR